MNRIMNLAIFAIVVTIAIDRVLANPPVSAQTTNKASTPANSSWQPISIGKIDIGEAKSQYSQPIFSRLINPSGGRIAYAATKWNTGGQTFLVEQSLSEKRGDSGLRKIYPIIPPQLEGQGKTTTSLDAPTPFVADPQYSPDGRFLLFKFGGFDSFGGYLLYVMDVQSGKARLITDSLVTYRTVSWSPDSKYITYIRGGDPDGNVWLSVASSGQYVGPLELVICNWRTGKEYVVAKNDYLSGPFGWTNSHTLIYGKVDSKNSSNRDPTAAKRPIKERDNVILQPNIYEYDTALRKSRLIINGGYRPIPSPDGEWIAFFGPADAKEPYKMRDDIRDNPQGLSLSIVRRSGQDRHPLTSIEKGYPSVLWRSDSKSFVTIQQNAPSLLSEAIIQEWDVRTQGFRKIATLKSRDQSLISRSPLQPQFRAIKISGETLYVVVDELVRINPQTSMSIIKNSLRTINLATGVNMTLVELTNSTGLDGLFPNATAK